MGVKSRGLRPQGWVAWRARPVGVCGRRDSYWARRVERGRSWVEGVARWSERVVVRRRRERGVESAQVRGLKLGQVGWVGW